MLDTALVDFHCHLDLYPDLETAVAECEAQAIYTLAVTTTPKAWARNHKLTAGTKYVRAALGLHPQLVASRSGEMALWEELLPQARYVGEIGLDAGPRFYRSFDTQKAVFERALKACARSGGKILTIHSVRAAKPVIDMLEAHFPKGRGVPVLHWFTGSAAEARRAVELGCYFSINADMMKDERRRAFVDGLPVDRLLTETDGPFTKRGERPARPGDVVDAVLALADLKGMDPLDMAKTVQRNLKAMLGE